MPPSLYLSGAKTTFKSKVLCNVSLYVGSFMARGYLNPAFNTPLIKLEDHSFSAFHHCSFNISAAIALIRRLWHPSTRGCAVPYWLGDHVIWARISTHEENRAMSVVKITQQELQKLIIININLEYRRNTVPNVR
jgi:hypothetical protein